MTSSSRSSPVARSRTRILCQSDPPSLRAYAISEPSRATENVDSDDVPSSLQELGSSTTSPPATRSSRVSAVYQTSWGVVPSLRLTNHRPPRFTGTPARGLATIRPMSSANQARAGSCPRAASAKSRWAATQAVTSGSSASSSQR